MNAEDEMQAHWAEDEMQGQSWTLLPWKQPMGTCGATSVRSTGELKLQAFIKRLLLGLLVTGQKGAWRWSVPRPPERPLLALVG